MARLLAPLAIVLIAAAPLVDTGSGTLAFSFAADDLQTETLFGPEADSEAVVSVRQAPDGVADVRISVRALVEAEGVRYRASADVSARSLSGALAEGDLIGLASQSTALLDTEGAVVRTSRRVRATDVRVRVSRLTDTEVHGDFVITSERDGLTRVSGSFVAPRPADV
ncbi:MAG: hypothetical protein AAF845_15435 [Bacteroidota bacterium]